MLKKPTQASFKRDPSRTVTLRRGMFSQLKRRLNAISKLIASKIVSENAFGIVQNTEWSFLHNDEKHKAFMEWLTVGIQENVLEVDWHQGYIQDAYTKGLSRAYNDLNKGRASVTQDFLNITAESEFIRLAFNQPETLSKVSLLFNQSFESLKGVTTDMAADISRVLAEGLTRGDRSDVVARSLVTIVSGMPVRRASLIAQTEIIRAHAEGQLDSLELQGETQVTAQVEFSTAGDDRVCPKCKPLEGKVYTIKEARGVIPVHPGCRCTWLPYIK